MKPIRAELRFFKAYPLEAIEAHTVWASIASAKWDFFLPFSGLNSLRIVGTGV